MARGLAGVHPAVGFLFFFGAAALTMFFAHPAYRCVEETASGMNKRTG